MKSKILNVLKRVFVIPVVLVLILISPVLFFFTILGEIGSYIKEQYKEWLFIGHKYLYDLVTDSVSIAFTGMDYQKYLIKKQVKLMEDTKADALITLGKFYDITTTRTAEGKIRLSIDNRYNW